MFKALKNLFTAEEEETEVQKNEENDHSSAENTLEQNPREEPVEEEIVIYPESDLSLEAPAHEEVLTAANNLFEKHQNGDGNLRDEKDYLLYSKKYEFCEIKWIIIDSRIENNEQLKNAFSQTVKKYNKDNTISVTYQNDDFVWFINSYSTSAPLKYVKKGAQLLKLDAKIYYDTTRDHHPKFRPNSIDIDICSSELINFYSHTDGYYSILDEMSWYKSYAISLIHYRTKDEMLYHRFYNHYSTHEDPFTNKTIFKWDSIGTPSDEYLNLIEEQLDKGFEPRTYITLDHWLYFKLKNVNGVDFITFEFRIKEMKLRAEDAIFFLLSNGEVIEFRLPKKFYTIEPRVLKGVDVPITQEELITLSKHEVEKVRVHEKKSNFKVDIEITDYINQWDIHKEYRQYVIRNLFADHLEQVEAIIDGYKPLTGDKKITEDQGNETCHVYLMKDQANNFYKIGISNQPNYRERTLQSEKPTIDLIASKEFPSRTIAESIEKALHDSYSDKRLRGEWFDLEPKDLKDIKATLK